jgi:hypothetical protein
MLKEHRPGLSQSPLIVFAHAVVLGCVSLYCVFVVFLHIYVKKGAENWRQHVLSFSLHFYVSRGKGGNCSPFLGGCVASA